MPYDGTGWTVNPSNTQPDGKSSHTAQVGLTDPTLVDQPPERGRVNSQGNVPPDARVEKLLDDSENWWVHVPDCSENRQVLSDHDGPVHRNEIVAVL